MSRQRILGFFSLLALLHLPAHAAWKPIFSDIQVTLAIDEATLETKGMTAKMWARERYNRPVQADPGDFFFKTVATQTQYACDKRTQTPLLTVYYDLADEEIKRINGDDKAQPVVPGSMDERRFNIACKVAPPVAVKPVVPPKPAKPVKPAPAAKPAAAAKPVEAPKKEAASEPAKPALVMPAQGKTELTEEAQLKGIVRNLLNDNAYFMKTHPASFFDPIKDGQYPRATVVTCADSRVQTAAFDQTPEGDLFMVRNIGNQLFSNQGSVEYGVHHLKTPLLIFVGHVACGAIKAAMSDYSEESPSIKKELSTLQIDKSASLTDNVIKNVNIQVRAARALFGEEVKSKKLTVMGAVYDFRDDLKEGPGKLVIVNFNGETDKTKISKQLAGMTTETTVSKKKPVKKTTP
ncbi:carbonic anhydrase [Leeia oryzae]|uniref:carbonic anhydrase n=1 Tax=Leeia oryzae TaxID=356662 RepID=UPI0012E9EB5A|nr:carbonic anhydrase [Leeia oryzae]